MAKLTDGIKNFGNGIFYLPYNHHSHLRDLGEFLSAFQEEHPNLKITAILPKPKGASAEVIGYYLICEEK